MEMVRTFHDKINSPISHKPHLLDPKYAEKLEEALKECSAKVRDIMIEHDVLSIRILLSLEEMAEWCHAHAQHDLIEVADAWADRLYVLLGDGVVTGMPAEPLFNAVHESNMTKEVGTKKGSKAIKGPNFKEPDITLALS